MPRFTAEDFIAYSSQGKVPPGSTPDPADVLVTSWDPGFVDRFQERIGGEKSRLWPYRTNPLFLGKTGDSRYAVIRARVGAPGMIVLLEEASAWCRPRTIIGIGFAGSLQQDCPVGSVIIPVSCISEEGTSRHYWEGPMIANQPLAESLERQCKSAGLPVVRSGSHWTTDAPYREFVDKIEEFAAEGVLGVDMETSAMYSFGLVKGIRICNLLVVTDELWTKWNPAFGHPKVMESVNKLVDVVLQNPVPAE